MLLTLQNELIEAMKNKDKPTIIGLRNIIGKIKAKKIDKGEDLTNEECLQVLNSAAKQLKESILQYEEGGRNDLANIEKFELSIIKRFLPEQLSEQKIRLIVKKNIQEINAKSMQDMGRIMGMVMKEVIGSADGNIVKKIVQQELN